LNVKNSKNAQIIRTHYQQNSTAASINKQFLNKLQTNTAAFTPMQDMSSNYYFQSRSTKTPCGSGGI